MVLVFLPEFRRLVAADVFVDFAENIAHCSLFGPARRPVISDRGWR
jgi:hypothetical protein